jgi:hypothetical protein
MSWKGQVLAIGWFAAVGIAYGDSANQTPMEVVADSLDLVTSLTTAHPGEIEGACREAGNAIVSWEKEANFAGATFNAVQYAKRIHGIYCLGRQDETGRIVASRPIIDEEASGMPAEMRDEIDETNTLWNTPPTCLRSEAMQECHYSHGSGKGVFIYQQPRPQGYPFNYLVCAQNATQHREGFLLFSTSNYRIRSKCVVSNFPWLNGPGGRSDANGVIDWPSRGVSGNPILMPRALAQQCELAFRDAIYCTPSLIAFATEKDDVVGICSLDTKRRNSRFLFIRFGRSHSRWNCELKDLSSPDPEPRVLGYDERNCNPDEFGLISLSCDLPYIPRSIYEHGDHFEVPR